MRPAWHEYYINIAKAVSKRSTCLRRIYGAIVVVNQRVISTGYNGSPRGHTNCCDKGSCWRQEHNITPGTMYEKCVSIHAEANACLRSNFTDFTTSDNKVLYVAGWDLEKDAVASAIPCLMCRRVIVQCNINFVYATHNGGIYKSHPSLWAGYENDSEDEFIKNEWERIEL